MTSVPSIECAVCRAPAELQEHFFFEGDPSNPVRRWRIVAPLYFNLEYRQGFCSAACSTIGHKAYHPSELPDYLKKALAEAEMDPRHEHLNELLDPPDVAGS
jgi:hypothetical protein